MSDVPTIGLIVPPADGAVPPEPLELYGHRAKFIAAGLALEQLSQVGYDGVINRVGDLARSLVAQGADAVSLMGTSLSFYRGPEFNQLLVDTMREATGRSVTTMTDSVVEAINFVGGRRLAVATAYSDEVNQKLADYLSRQRLQIVSLRSLNLVDVETVRSVNSDTLMSLVRETMQDAPQADTIFISCGGLKTKSITPVLEAEFGLPVISSAMAGAWGAMRAAGLDAQAKNAGRLFGMRDNIEHSPLSCLVR